MLCLAAYAKINWTLDILGTTPGRIPPDGYADADRLPVRPFVDGRGRRTSRWRPCPAARSARPVPIRTTVFPPPGCAMTSPTWVYRAALLLRERLRRAPGAPAFCCKNAFPRARAWAAAAPTAPRRSRGSTLLWGLGLSRAEPVVSGPGTGVRTCPFFSRAGWRAWAASASESSPSRPAPQVWLVLVQPCEGLEHP